MYRSVLRQLVTLAWSLGAISQLETQIFEPLVSMWTMKQLWGARDRSRRTRKRRMKVEDLALAGPQGKCLMTGHGNWKAK